MRFRNMDMGDPGEGCRERPIGYATEGSGGEAFVRDAGFFFFVWKRGLRWRR